MPPTRACRRRSARSSTSGSPTGWRRPGRDRLAELDEIVGYHLEQARSYRLALAPDDARTRELGAAGRPPAEGRGDSRARAERTRRPRCACSSAPSALLVDDPARPLRRPGGPHRGGLDRQRGERLRRGKRALQEIAPRLGEVAVLRARLADWQARAFTDPSFTVTAHVAEADAARPRVRGGRQRRRAARRRRPPRSAPR